MVKVAYEESFNRKKNSAEMVGEQMGKQVANFNTDASLYHVKLAVFVSLLAWPITYIFNNAFEGIDQTARPFWMMAYAFLILTAVVAVVAKFSYINDVVYYGAVLFTFTAVVDLIITLEFNGLIHNFMSEYLKLGEPYLASPWGSAIALFDGIGFLPMYLGLVYLVSNGKNWRSLGLYWAAGIINSMIVLLLGIFSGRHSPTFCSFLNVPYVIFPIYALRRCLMQEEAPKWNSTKQRSITIMFVDLFLSMSLTISAVIILAKSCVALAPTTAGVDFWGFLKHEPSFLFDDPAPFPMIQAIVYLLYLVPVQVVTSIHLLCGNVPAFLWEMTLVHAGVMIQGQFSVIGLALDPQTPSEYKSEWTSINFWFNNLFILIVPHAVLFRLVSQHEQPISKTREDKKQKSKKHN